MKKEGMFKRIAGLTLAATMMFSLASCGNGGGGNAAAAAAQVGGDDPAPVLHQLQQAIDEYFKDEA